jgi:MoxR-like ATPase
MNTFPLEGDPLPAGYSGWLLFLDELNSAPIPVQSAAYKLILDRKVGLFNLHPNVAMVAAGNLETDGAIVNPMSTALASRMAHLFVELNVKDWLNWANESHLDYRITSFIEFLPTKLNTHTPDNPEMAYASPRTWEFSDRILKLQDINRDLLPMYAGLFERRRRTGVLWLLSGQCFIAKDRTDLASTKHNNHAWRAFLPVRIDRSHCSSCQ